MSDHPRGMYRDPARFEDDIARFEREAQSGSLPTGAVMGYGSSTLRLWGEGLKRDLEPLTVINRGFGGSNANDALHFADRVILPLRPRAILLYFGGNDIEADRVEPKRALGLLEMLFDRMQGALPKLRWYVLTLKLAPRLPQTWDRVKSFNRQIEGVCATRERHTLVDVSKPTLDAKGEPKPKFFAPDQLHLSRAGYGLWREVIRPVLVEREGLYESVD
ncbi:MAG: GDSL-type esterase/lipase family protein [Verrucomicrobiota bacterium]